MDHTMKQIFSALESIAARLSALEDGTGRLTADSGAVVVQVGGPGGDGSVSTEEGSHGRGVSLSWSDSVDEELPIVAKHLPIQQGADSPRSEAEPSTSGSVVSRASSGSDKAVDVCVANGPSDQVKRVGNIAEFVMPLSEPGARSVSDSSESETGGIEPAVTMPAGKVLTEATTMIKFGEVSDHSSEGGFKTLVRNDRVLALKEWIRKSTGVTVPSRSLQKLAIATYTAGSMPNFFERGKDELKMLALVGDAALTLAVARRMYGVGSTVESSQGVRSSMLSDVKLREALFRHGLAGFVVAPTGVDLSISKAGATAFEAIAGVLELTSADKSAVLKFAYATGLLE